MAITLKPARRASWIAIEPTPPAPPMISSDWPLPPCALSNGMRWNNSSHAVIVVSGKAAAAASSIDRGA